MTDEAKTKRIDRENLTLKGDGEIELLMIVRAPGGEKHIPLRVWTTSDAEETDAIGIVLEASMAKMVGSFWSVADEAVREAVANAPDNCDCPKCTARRAIESGTGIEVNAIEINLPEEVKDKLREKFIELAGGKLPGKTKDKKYH